MFNTGGLAYKLGPSATGSSKSSLSLRSKLTQNDSGLPPQLPPRNGSGSTNYNPISSIGYGKGSLSGPEQGHETHKESSAARFKDLFKNVGLSNQHSAGPASTIPSTTEHHSPIIGPSKAIQSRSAFYALGEFLSGDDQPAASKGFRLKGSGKRKKRFTKKSHTAAGVFATFAPVATDDEDSSASKSGRLQLHNHSILHHLHHRHRSRSTGEEGRGQVPLAWRQGPALSAALKEARNVRPDPNLLLVELEPLPTDFVNAFTALSASRAQHPQGPLTTHITPSLTVNSGFAHLLAGPIGTFTNHQSNASLIRPVAKCSDTINTKTFLFKFYQNSRFQGHYVFRVVEDRVEYKILPSALEQACSQYFREAYVTYRALENKAKTLKEERARRRINLFWAEGPESAGVAAKIERRGSDSGPGSKIQNSAVAWDQMALTDAATTLSESSVGTPNPQGRRTPEQMDQRSNTGSSYSPIFKAFTRPTDRSSSAPVERNGAMVYNSAVSQPGSQRSALYHSRRRSWSSINDQQRLDQQQQHQAMEDAYWREMERKYREEFKQATYGLELYLNEIIKGQEYERFDSSAAVSIANENRNTAVFSIINGDRTNVMWLESPSAKLKNEFLNWIAIATMDHRQPEPEPEQETTSVYQSKLINKARHVMFMDFERDDSEDAGEKTDLLLDMIGIRLAQQEEKLMSMRNAIQNTMWQIKDCLERLDHLDEGAKKRMTEMIRATDSQEVQLALRPSPSTNLTLAETVDWKLRDVQERILVCARIMNAARYNLNRLRYEIELEQRSIRLFRQYKIIIAVVSISVVLLAWFLYHSRANASNPQSPSPLFPTTVNPFEAGDSHLHPGEHLTLTSPVIPTLEQTSKQNIVNTQEREDPVLVKVTPTKVLSGTPVTHEDNDDEIPLRKSETALTQLSSASPTLLGSLLTEVTKEDEDEDGFRSKQETTVHSTPSARPRQDPM
ncbi:hypothetical protein BGZ54_001875 [Gamsiella multidivaricata]|nr:hypothetical protein BGZ54_001875 [Gamsiella multidivaricata]